MRRGLTVEYFSAPAMVPITGALTCRPPRFDLVNK